MAKRMVLDIMQGVLSDYLEIDESNFNLGLWSGSITLQDVKLRNDNLFRGMNLTGVHGIVRKLEIHIPWASLMSSPVRIEIDGVYCQLKSVNGTNLNRAEARQRASAAKQEKIAFADKFLSYHSQHDSHGLGTDFDSDDETNKKSNNIQKKDNQTWIEAYTTKIVDNLEINLKNIHIRYEDTETIPGHTFSAGITWSSFLLATTDEEWKTTFIARKSNQAIRKLCQGTNFGLYWNMDSKSLEDLSFNDWQEAMHSIIYTTPAPDHRGIVPPFIDDEKDALPYTPHAMKYIILPTNKLKIKVKHNDHLDSTKEHGEPKYDVSVVTEEIALSLDGLQYKQLDITLDKMNKITKSKQLYTYKPQRRPVDKESIKQWWKYACKLVIKRPRYIQLVKLLKTADPNNNFKDSLTDNEKYEIQELEERLPLQTIIIFRHMAAEEMELEAKRLRDEYKKNKGKNSSSFAISSNNSATPAKEVVKERTWWGFFSGEPLPESSSVGDEPISLTWDDTLPEDEREGGSKYKGYEGEDVPISAIVSEFEDYRKSQEAKSITHAVFCKVTVQSGSVLKLSTFGVPVLTASMSVKAESITTSTGTTELNLDLYNMSAIDEITPNPILSKILSVKDIDNNATYNSVKESKPNFTVKFLSSDTKKSLHVTSLPLQFACNQICIQNIINIFFYPKPLPDGRTAADELIKERRKRIQTTNALLMATSGQQNNVDDTIIKTNKKHETVTTDDAFEITFEAHAPKIIIPEDSSSEKGYLLVDMGYLKVRGFTCEAGMNWDISLSDVNAGMPYRVSDMYNLAQKGNEHLYLIKPFDIEMAVQNIDRTYADMTVDLDFKPGICGGLTASKLTRLMDLMAVATVTFLEPPNNHNIPEMEYLRSLDVTFLLPKLRSTMSSTKLDLADAVRAAAKVKRITSLKSNNHISSSIADCVLDEDETDNSDIQYLITDLNAMQELEGGTIGKDPAHVGLILTMNIPTISLDLTYNENTGDHQIFEIKSMNIKLINRPYDLNFNFKMGSLSIEDSMRSISQKYLVYTPKEKQNDNLIEISYITCQTLRSPYYKDHGSICIVNFANLNMVLDVNTLMHLRPFIIVLLHKDKDDKKSNSNNLNQQNNDITSDGINDAAAAQVNSISVTEKPEHMHMVISMQTLSLDILRVRDVSEDDEEIGSFTYAGKNLDKAFSLRFIGMCADMDMRLLMKALVTMKSVEVLDIREISRDYAIKRVFGPMTLGRGTSTATADSKSSPRSTTSVSSEGIIDDECDDSNKVEEDRDIVRVDFTQESKTVSHIDILLLDASTYGSTDTFLDLSNVALDNFLAIIELLEKPPPEFYDNPNTIFTSVQSSSSLRDLAFNADDDNEEDIFRDSMSSIPADSTTASVAAAVSVKDTTDESQDLTTVDPNEYEQQTMALVVRMENPRLLLIDDPTAEDSQAIVGTCAGEIHYTRETTIEKATGIKEFRESIHLSLKELEVYVLKNVQLYYPKAILQPMSVELNMRRQAYDGNILLSNISVDTGNALCRVTLNDIVLAQSILFRGASVDSKDKTASGSGASNTRRRLGSDTGNIASDNTKTTPTKANNDADAASLKYYTLLCNFTSGLAKSSMGNHHLLKNQMGYANGDISNPNGEFYHRFKLEWAHKLETSAKIWASDNNDIFINWKKILSKNVKDAAATSQSMSPGSTTRVKLPDTQFNVVLNFGQISLTTINDFYSQDLPVAKMLWEESTMALQKKGDFMEGEGDLYMSASFYNSQLNVWEPIVDRWHPKLSIDTGRIGTVFNIRSAHTMQVTVSGKMLQTFLETSSLLQQVQEMGNNNLGRDIVPEMSVENALGSSIEIQLYDSMSGQHLVTVDSGKTDAIPKVKPTDSKHTKNNSRGRRGHHILGSKLPTSIDIHFGGKFGEERVPIQNLPLFLNKPRLCHIHHKPATSNSDEHKSNSTSATSKSIAVVDNDMVIVEPIEEETFENQRFDPLLRCWREPFLSNDPKEWTDSSCLIEKKIEDVDAAGIKDGRWEWQGRWNISSVHGINADDCISVDEDGWEYSTAFSNFSIASVQRTFQKMDQVRRRRWARTRMLKNAVLSVRQRLLVLHWDVRTLNNGSRSVLVRSGLRVHNNMPFPISIILSYAAWDNDVELGPINASETFCVPLFVSCATGMTVRPSSSITNTIIHNKDSSNSLADDTTTPNPYEWSRILPCGVQTYDFTSNRGIICKEANNSRSMSPVCMYTTMVQEQKSLIVTFNPYIIIENCMPFDIRYKITCTDGKEQEDEVYCGATGKVSLINSAANPSISLCTLCTLTWSSSITLPQNDTSTASANISNDKKSKDIMIEIPNSQGPLTGNDKNKDNGIVIMLNVTFDKGIMHIKIYPRYIFIDRTGLKISLLTTKSNKKQMLRNSFGNSEVFSPRRSSSVIKDSNIINEIGENAADVWQENNGKGPIENFIVDSNNEYIVTSGTTHADLVYTDREFIWSHLPEPLRNQQYIRTAHSDKLRRARSFMQFDLQRAAYVILLIGVNEKRSPQWLREDGYDEMIGHAIARRIHQNEMQEICYTPYGKHFPAGSHVSLRGNFNKDISVMYSVFVIPSPPPCGTTSPVPTVDTYKSNSRDIYSSQFFSQISLDHQYHREHANVCWQDGGQGMCLFHTYNDNVTIGVKNGKAWSDEISITMANVTHNQSFEVVDWETSESYQLTYNLRYMPGIFSNTQEVVIMPKFAIVNLLDEELMIIQKGSKDSHIYQPYRAESWHKKNVNLGTTVQIRCRSSFWSLGTIDISEIGTSSLHLPRKDDSTNGNDAIILHVEVKLASPGEHCSVVVLIWRASVESSTDISIHNETDCAVTVMQKGIELDKELSDRKMFQLCLAPFTIAPFGWADPDLESSVLVTVGTEIDNITLSGRNSRQRICEISLLKAGEQIRLPDNTGRPGVLGEVVLSVSALNGARVLSITRPDKYQIPDYHGSISASSSKNNDNNNGADVTKGYEINFFLSSFGISLVVEKPIRREFFSLYMDGISMQKVVYGGLSSTELKIQNLQIDNYSETCLYPVLLHESKSDNNRSIISKSKNTTTDNDSKPLIQITWVSKETYSENRMPIYKFFVCRILPLSIQVDSATIQLLYTDLLNDLKYISREQTLASATPNIWMDDRNKYMFSAERLLLLDVYSSKASSMQDKMYFENMIIHPIRLQATFTQTAYPRKGSKHITLQSTFMNIVTSFAGVDELDLKLNSFKVSDALESTTSLQGAFIYKTCEEIKGQLVDVIGSMAAIGAPLGFAKKIGSGVSDLFYEPLQGIVHSPSEFINGLGRGTTSFANSVLSGFSSSISGMSVSASKGLGYLTGDGEYVRQREQKRQTQKVRNDGFFGGIANGVESVGSGVISGLSGIVSKPVEEASKGGVGGFFKGVGLGLLGAVTKPVMGITDGVSAVATGITSQVTKTVQYVHVRPVRAMERSPYDPSELVIGPMNVKAGKAQEFIIKRSKEQNYDDIYLGYISLNDKTDEAIILTETYLYWRKEKSLWGRTWSNISHSLFFGDSVGIFLYTNSGSSSNENNKDIVEIPCQTREKAIALYEVLALHSLRMGNPCNVLPLASVVQDEWLVDREYRESVLAVRGKACGLDNRLDGYKFGTCNILPFKNESDQNEDSMLRGFQRIMDRPFSEWSELDSRAWTMIEYWDTAHTGLNASRCCAFTIINRSESPIQIVRIQMVHGHKVVLLGSGATGYDAESRAIMPNGVVIVFASAFVPTPLEIGHFKAHIDCPAFTATVASTQRESSCEARGTFHVGFLEKSVSEWWSKYVLVVS